MICDYVHIKKQVEVISVIVIAIWVLSCDETPSQLNSNLEELWEEYDEESYDCGRLNLEEPLKYLLTFVILVRAYTSRLFLVLYVLILWPAIYESNPSLLLPWLVVGFLRSILLIFITMYIGCYVCYVQKGVHLICLDFIFAQCIDHGPPIYAWFSILSYYRELKDPKMQKNKSEIQQTTSICNTLITDDTFINIMLHLKPVVIPTRSLDTLLSQNETIFNYEIKENCSLPDIVKNILHLNDDDIIKIKQSKANKNLELNYDKATGVSVSSMVEEKELVCVNLNDILP